jgi:hypothetical protein
MSFGGGDITGTLREGAEERIRASSLSGIEGKRIVIESVSITYRLEEQPSARERLGMSDHLMVMPPDPATKSAAAPTPAPPGYGHGV